MEYTVSKKKESKELKSGVVLSYISIGLTIIVSLFYTPILIRMLGQNEYGLFSLAFSVIGTFAILDVGMGNANVRYTAKYRTEGNREKEYSLHGMFLLLYSIIAIVALVLGIFLYFNVTSVFGEKMTGEEISLLKNMLLFIVPYTCLILPLNIFNSIIRAYEKFVFDRFMVLLNIILIPVVSLVLLYSGYRSLHIVVAIIIVNLLLRAIRVVYCFRTLKIKLSFRGINWGFYKEIFSYTFYIFLGVMAFRLNDNVGQIILGANAGTQQIAIFAIGITLMIQYRSIALAISNLMLPIITRVSQGEDADKKNNDYFMAVGRIQFYVLSVFMLGYIFFGRHFIILWAGENYEPAYWVSLFLLALIPINQIQSIATTILTAQKRHQFINVLAFVTSVTYVLASSFFSGKYGALGVAVVFFVISCISLIIRNVYFSRVMNLNIMNFWLRIAAIVPAFMLPLAFAVLYNYFVDTSSWLFLSIGIVGFAILYVVSLVLFSFNSFEKSLVVDPVLSMINKLLKRK